MCRAYALLPNAISKYLYHYSCWYLDLTMSNVQAGSRPMYLWDKEILNLYGYLAPFWNWNLNFTYNSYRDNVFAQITADKNLQMDPKQLMKIFEEILDEQIQIE